MCILAIGECDVGDSDKVDCGYFGINQVQCEANNCCWKESSVSGVPYCFHRIGESDGNLMRMQLVLQRLLQHLEDELISCIPAQNTSTLKSMVIIVFYSTSFQKFHLSARLLTG